MHRSVLLLLIGFAAGCGRSGAEPAESADVPDPVPMPAQVATAELENDAPAAIDVAAEEAAARKFIDYWRGEAEYDTAGDALDRRWAEYDERFADAKRTDSGEALESCLRLLEEIKRDSAALDSRGEALNDLGTEIRGTWPKTPDASAIWRRALKREITALQHQIDAKRKLCIEKNSQALALVVADRDAADALSADSARLSAEASALHKIWEALSLKALKFKF